jgi:hypothetical protein
MDQKMQALVVEVDRLRRKVGNQRRELKRLNRKMRFVMAEAAFPEAQPDLPLLEDLKWALSKSKAREQFAVQMIGRYRAKLQVPEDSLPTVLDPRRASRNT